MTRGTRQVSDCIAEVDRAAGETGTAAETLRREVGAFLETMRAE